MFDLIGQCREQWRNSVDLPARLEKHKKSFEEICAKIKECDENIFRFQNIKAQLIGERDIAKGRYNEVKEMLEEVKP